jgi:DNA-binding SARP family transcriptional activator
MFELFLLGDIQLEIDGRPIEINSRKALALLVYLGVSNQHHDRESLATLFWPEFKQTRARASLRRTLWALDQTPVAEFIDAGQENVNLRADDGIRIDAVQLRDRIAAWREAKVGKLDDRVATELADITATYHGEFLADLYLADSSEFEDWALAQRERLRRDVLDALHALADYCLDLGDFETAQIHAWRQLEIDNLREGAYRQLMTALAQSGQRIAALAQYERLRDLLEQELGVEPSSETTRLYEQIRAESIPADSRPAKPQAELTAEVVENGPMPLFLFTDIENSTPLWDQHREAMLVALLQHNRILEEQIQGYGGRILESRGDGVRAVFEGGRPLESVIAIQKAFGAADWGEIGEMRIRLGLHGVREDWEGYDYFREGDAFFGPLLNYAARIMDAAWGGQILVSENVKDAFPLPDGASWEPFGEHELKGCEEPIHIYGLLHPELPHQSFPPPRTLSSPVVLGPDQTHPSDQADLEETGVALRPSSPYRGLFSFREEDAPFFFGRESFTDLLMETVREQSMLAVVGPSGSGKSSVVHAGLLSQLRQQGNWLITTFRPGSRPFHALAAALIPYLEPDLSKTDQMVQTNNLAEALQNGDVALIDVVNNILQDQPPGTRLPLVGDQFEELYTLVPENELRDHFMDVLTDAVYEQQYRPSPFFSFILTLRADFMGQALAHRPFADALQETDVILGPMTQGELGRAIVSPAKKLAVDFETGLVPRILDDVGAEPGNLPLLEFALAMLWERQDRALMTHDAYEAIGRVDGALARHADAVFDELSADQQESARRIFIQVVRPGEGTEDTRRLATRAELGEADWGLVQHLADSRLLVTGRDAESNETVEVVHEALIRGWGRLREWMEADRDFRVWQERLRAAIRQWQASERDDGALLRGVTLASAERWLAERPDDLSLNEKEFIEASIDLRERREADRERRRMPADGARTVTTPGDGRAGDRFCGSDISGYPGRRAMELGPPGPTNS